MKRGIDVHIVHHYRGIIMNRGIDVHIVYHYIETYEEGYRCTYSLSL